MPDVAVVVLGDVGRSPRMQYHCTSLASLPNTTVHLVGYSGEKCIPAIEERPKVIKKYLITPPFVKTNRKYFLFTAPLKVVYQLLVLLWYLLVSMPPCKAILVQNPPSIPALLVVWFVCRLRGSRMVIDWHNFGYTILGLSLGTGHLLVILSRLFEKFFASRADDHLCVTNAMQAWLSTNWNIDAHVLHDRASESFKAISLESQHALFVRLGLLEPVNDSRILRTPFTQLIGGSVGKRSERPALLVSSTSWTADEDFGVLLDALKSVDVIIQNNRKLYPRIFMMVTGKGPQRALYEEKIAKMNLQCVTIRTAWLDAADYPQLLASADIGISLHYSSSGLDLPMKVVDMFGAGLPVLAMDFMCLSELVKDGQNGYTFKNSAELAEKILFMLKGFPLEPFRHNLNTLRQGVKEFQRLRWTENWNEIAKPLFV